jgi:threonine/homoserine/homoserine lactone efflux protein
MESSPVILGFVAMLAGIAGGFSSSAPIGPINLWLTDATLAKDDDRIKPFVAGVIAVDCLWAALAAWGYQAWLSRSGFATGLTLLGGAFLITLGVLGMIKLRAVRKGDQERVARKPRPIVDALLGAMFCGGNPGFPMFWVFAIDLARTHLGVVMEGATLPAFLCGVATGDCLWFIVLTTVVRRGERAVAPGALTFVRAGIAALFLLIGGFTLVKGIV